MRFKQAMLTVLDSRGYTQSELARDVGVSAGAISSMLRKGNPSVAVINKYMHGLGYQVVLVPIGARMPNGCYVLTEGVNDRKEGDTDDDS